MIFLDSSAIVKLYSNEIHSEELRSKLNDQNPIISRLGVLEFHSAIWKKERSKLILKNDALEILYSFSEDLKHYEIIEIEGKIWEEAINLINKYGSLGLRTLDSIQIASALSLNSKVEIISFDNLFNEIVKLENKDLLNKKL